MNADDINDMNLLSNEFFQVIIDIEQSGDNINNEIDEILNELKVHGCQFALDDFGSGLSSFAYLKTLPVNYLKIDASLVKDISRDKIDRAMVESIQQVGKIMELMTIAEHVEDEPTLSILREIGVDYVQGYHLGRPEAIEIK